MCCVSAVLFGNVLHDDDPCFLQVVYLPSIPCRAEIAWRVRIRNNCAPGGALANRDVNCISVTGGGYPMKMNTGFVIISTRSAEHKVGSARIQSMATRSTEHKVGSPNQGWQHDQRSTRLAARGWEREDAEYEVDLAQVNGSEFQLLSTIPFPY